MKKYRVKMYIRGSITRPPYSGYVDVVADNPEDAARRAKQELKRTSFPDAWYEDFRVQEVIER